VGGGSREVIMMKQEKKTEMGDWEKCGEESVGG
jgi:hypothetical protein